jgi:RNA polymerase sigma-70 factor (ECF subfamily)
VSAAARFTDLYSRYGGDVYRFALYLSGNSAVAEDVTAETFLRIWNLADSVRPSTVKAYLLAIARNLYRHELRTSRREIPLSPVIPAGCSLEREAESRAEFDRVIAGLQRLPEVDRAAVLLRAEDGLSYEEIAVALDISVTAAKVKVHRARLKLAEARGRSVETS